MTPDGRGFNGQTKPAMEQYSGSKSSAVFTDDQLAIRDLTRRFVRSEILPNILQWDEEGLFLRMCGSASASSVFTACARLLSGAVLTVGLLHGP